MNTESVLVMLATFALAQGQSRLKEPAQFRDLESPDVATRVACLDTSVKERAGRVAALLRIAKLPYESKKTKSPKELAIALLGEYRAVEAVDFLVENVSFRPAVALADAFKELSPFDGYPSAQALVKIGTPCMEGIFRRMSKPCDKTEIRLFAYLVRTLDGHELGLYRLDAAAKRAEAANDPVARTNFRNLIERYKRITGL